MQRHRVLAAHLPLLRYLHSETWQLKACVNFCSNMRPALPRDTGTSSTFRVSFARYEAEALLSLQGGTDVARKILVVNL